MYQKLPPPQLFSIYPNLKDTWLTAYTKSCFFQVKDTVCPISNFKTPVYLEKLTAGTNASLQSSNLLGGASTATSNRIYYYLIANSHCSLCHILPYYLKTTITIEWVLKHLCCLRFAKMLNLRENLVPREK